VGQIPEMWKGTPQVGLKIGHSPLSLGLKTIGLSSMARRPWHQSTMDYGAEVFERALDVPARGGHLPELWVLW
jgi:hypothetical protein